MLPPDLKQSDLKKSHDVSAKYVMGIEINIIAKYREDGRTGSEKNGHLIQC